MKPEHEELTDAISAFVRRVSFQAATGVAHAINDAPAMRPAMSKGLAVVNQPTTRAALTALWCVWERSDDVGPSALSLALQTAASTWRHVPSPPQLVWTGPDLPEDTMRKTQAVAAH